MKSLLLLGVLGAYQPTDAQYGRIQHPGEPPYRPFPPYKPWPWRPPAPIPPAPKEPVIPKLKSTPNILGLVDDPKLNRDSCGSATFGDRTFWTCRDTQLFYSNGSVQIFPLITSTASWTDFAPGGGPDLQPLSTGADQLHTIILKQYGNNSIKQAFFPLLPDFCQAPAGNCPDGTRYALWPDLPPMVTSSSPLTGITAYTWIRQSHIRSDLSTVTENPASLLYRVKYHPSTSYGGENSNSTALPSVTIIDEQFWAENEISFGNYGNVVKDGIAYLYGQAEGLTSLAKFPCSLVEDKSAYEYWVNGTWNPIAPPIGSPGINITNANAGGQGTYYFSNHWNSYVWVGGAQTPGADMYITTAPAPEGPWIEPIKFYTGVNGNYFLGAYSIQAHPGLSKDGDGGREVYITYTKNDLDAEGVNVYTSPLVRVEWG